MFFFFFSSRRRHTRFDCDWSSDVCSSDLSGPQILEQGEMIQHDLLKADIQRAQKIRDNIPATQKDCDRFERSLFPASSGYSAVRAELGSIAGKSGSRLENIAFKQTDIASRGMTE